MPIRIVIAAGIAVIAYVAGVRSARPSVLPRESLRHQAERLWNDPKARKRRERRIREIETSAKRAAKRAKRAARR